MVRKILIFSLLILSFNASAAFYINMKGGNKITLDDNITQAVYVGAEGNVLRFKKKSTERNQIDDDGRPFSAVIFANVKCLETGPCNEYELFVKFYSDKKSGASVIFFDTNKNKIISSEDIVYKNIAMD